MRKTTLIIACGLTMACVSSALTTANGSATSLTTDARDNKVGIQVDNSAVGNLRIKDVRFERPEDFPQPASVLKFEVLNDSDRRLADIVIHVAIHIKDDGLSETSRIGVRPFNVDGQVTIEAGYSVSYAVLLRNLPADCECEADVTVISAREVSELRQD